MNWKIKYSDMIIVMRSYTQNLLRILFLVGFVASFAVWQRHENQWEYMIFTQQWPIAVCVDINNTKGTECSFPKQVKGWTVHGLWPSSVEGPNPFYCNNSYPFKENEIKDLEPTLMVWWPNMIAKEPLTSFWKHEWEKHGTCSMSLPVLDTEHKYFDQSLLLNMKFNLTSILSSNSILPSATQLYEFQKVVNAIEAATAKNAVKMQCIFSRDRSVQALIQIELCMDKSFGAIACPEHSIVSNFVPKWDSIPYNPEYESCTSKLDVKYLPFSYVEKDLGERVFTVQ